MGDERKRVTLHNKLKGYLSTVNAHSSRPLSLLSAKELMVRVEEVWTDFLKIQEALEATATDDAAYQVQVTAAEGVEATFTDVRGKLRFFIESLTAAAAARSTTSTTPTPTATTGASIKLPTISLPDFDGSYSEWTSFKDLFNAAVNNNSNLTDAQKLQYLKTSVRGDAAGLISYLSTTDTNYKEAWDLLNGRYDNKREIVYSQLNKLIDLKSMKGESAAELQTLIDSCVKCLHSLKNQGCPTDKWDDIIVLLMVRKLDPVTRREWAKRLTGNDLPTLKNLQAFCECHIRGLQAAGTSSSSAPIDRRGEKHIKVHHVEASTSQCPACSDSHQLQQCKQFLNSSPSERSAIAKRARLCYNCLRGEHMIKQCSSKGTCKKCSKKHHTLLHEERPVKPPDNKPKPPDTVVGHHVSDEARGLLMTAIVHLQDKFGVNQPCRVLIDNGSTGEFMSEPCIQRLGLSRDPGRVKVKGFGNKKVGSSRGIVSTTLFNRDNDKLSVDVKLHVLPKLTGLLPTMRCQNADYHYLQGLKLADPEWHEPGRVDLMVGIKYFHKILLHQRIPGPTDDDPVAWETIFGWVVSGACPTDDEIPFTSFHVEVDPVDLQLRKFWEVEEPPKKRILTQEEKICEDHFQSTYKRDDNGRFIVGVPFDQDKKKTLGKSRDIAHKRLLQVEKRLQRQPDLQQQYLTFMQEYESMGHMSLVPASSQGEQLGKTNYLCHHFVKNESSTTTKLRVVFDGSAPTTTGVSFNSTMFVGAVLQDNLYDLLLRFRVHAVVIKADIAKMFRQFRLLEKDASLHRILWRESLELPVKEYQLDTVTYGTACAPNLATRCIQQLGMDCATAYPEASEALLNDAYVDDILTGCQTPTAAIALYHQLNLACESASLELRKWTSNSSEVLDAIPEEFRETSQLVFEDDETVKALGVQWHPASDTFKFKLAEFEICKFTTKRSLLSNLAKVFDPLGLISCVTLRGKLLLQELWKITVDWDETVPESVHSRWEEYRDDLQNLQHLTIPRRITVNGAAKLELHGFSDSSELGYGGIIYLRSLFPNGSVEVRFVTSKTRVAPVRQVTLPRLELCAAVLVAELVTHVKECLHLNVDINLWSDSTITLMWISASPRRWKTYVANRVATIQALTKVDCWHHVSGVENPADLASRGCRVEELVNSNFWWNGPKWLSNSTIPVFPQLADTPLELEERQTELVHHVEIGEDVVIQRFSTINKLKRLTAWYIRFLQYRIVNACDSASLNERRLASSNLQRFASSNLTASELHSALQLWIRKTQQQYFLEEYKCLKKKGQVSTTSKLKRLAPFVDKYDIIRVSGRLRNASLPEENAHQVILPSNSHLAGLLVHHYHELCLHGGFQVTWSALQAEYWVLGGRGKVRHIIRSCVRCRRYRAQAAEQLMGDLPGPRVTPSRPFLHTGVDYAGPFTIRDVIGRVPKVYKGYMCLFVCLSTKAIHLEGVSSLSTEAFLAALRRFVARRGLCSHMYSDCGTNFVGADRELQTFVGSEAANEVMSREMSGRGVTWHFNPPAAPHQGGLWEAGVKSAKYHFRRVVGASSLTFEHFTTVLAQVEAVLNSRPLCTVPCDPEDLQVLTPGHFLIGGPLLAAPDANIVDLPSNRLSQFQRLQQQLQHFWRRWSQEYLNTLQQRNKWMWERDNLQIGDIVLLVEETPPATWKMGRVLEVHKGSDGNVRTVTVKTATSTFRRVIAKLVPLVREERQ